MVPKKSDGADKPPPCDPAASLAESRRASLTATVEAMNQDFERLVATLERTIELVGASDEELLSQLDSAKAAAERGVRLTRLAKELAQKKPG